MQNERQQERARHKLEGVSGKRQSILYLPIGKVSGNGGAKMMEFWRETTVLGACMSGYFMNRRVAGFSGLKMEFLNRVSMRVTCNPPT